MNVLLIDNVDSFVYNLYQYLGELGADVEVRRNNITPDEVSAIKHDSIVISPGPGTPEEAGNTVDIIKRFAGKTPILGVCLGHQAIGVAFGGHVERAKNIMHGKTSEIEHDGRGVYRGISNPIISTRYHSLCIADEGLPEALEVTARSREDDIIMGVRHRSYTVEGVQFHPESILTTDGKQILKNFLEFGGDGR
ncbi:MAG: anthranilate synthase component II [Candidatus Hydrothermarchaeaceae archaeon]